MSIASCKGCNESAISLLVGVMAVAAIGKLQCERTLALQEAGAMYALPQHKRSLACCDAATWKGRSTTDWPASKAVGISGASCCSCQDGLQVVCQLLHCDGVAGQLLGNLNQPALLSQQVGTEHCTPRQPAVYASMLAERVRNVLS